MKANINNISDLFKLGEVCIYKPDDSNDKYWCISVALSSDRGVALTFFNDEDATRIEYAMKDPLTGTMMPGLHDINRPGEFPDDLLEYIG